MGERASGRKLLWVSFSILWLLFSASQLAASNPRPLPPPSRLPPSAEQILERADDAKMPSGDFSAQVVVEDWNQKSRLRENTYRVSCKSNVRALIETTAPVRLQGRKILLRDNDLWLYLPSLKRATRVSLQQRLTGEVANGDIARSNFHEDYFAKLQGTEILGGRPHYKLELRARHKDATYRKLDLWVDTGTFQPKRAAFYAISGKLLKTSEYSSFEPVLGKMRATRIVIRDALQPNRYSEMKYSKYRREKFDDSFFSKESLP
jgi:outer membrane lipoprotein-sorting protein